MTLPCRDAGEGPAILFLHGWTMRGAVFDDQIARLSGRFRCLAPDLPGHGGARERPGGIGAAADALARLLDARGLDRVTLVGWSMGAAVAWRLGARHGSERIAAMLSVEMGPRLRNGPDWRLGLRQQEGAPLPVPGDWAAGADAIARSMFAPGAPDALVERAARWVRDNDGAAMAALWRELLAMDAREDLAALSGVPLTAAYGARSRVYPPETAHWVAQAVPGGRVHRFARSGHSPHLEEPEAFAALVARIAAESAARQARPLPARRARL
ncbi:alpha/beta hydrolase [Rhodosalinus halophilus]|uniref:Alpha/beta hydrolase n=1 Tax=Rhodosalinus halophilus TaxID=2259333 RepID=A0A365U990_9RHOB|nr:alpha/beta hydrolase [Rhodosalinus halophilus]RBI85514.1 alpha/beta hydrolase [Rhodosalinus halophilus]